MSADLLFAWMMVFLRALGTILLLPTLGNRPLPITMRVAIAALLAVLLYGIVPRAAALPTGNGNLIVAALGEVVLGLVLGFVGRLVFAAVDVAGRFVTQSIGMMAAPGIDPPSPTSEPLAAFFSMFAGLLFFLFGGHFGALSAFARSFDFAAAGAPNYSPMATEYIIKATGQVIELGFRMAAPFVAMDFLVNLSFSVLGRAVPRMNVFVMSYPLRTLVGCILLASSGGLMAKYLWPEFQAMPYRILEMVAGA
jgi:flagellar biosynthetic protein FliR